MKALLISEPKSNKQTKKLFKKKSISERDIFLLNGASDPCFNFSEAL